MTRWTTADLADRFNRHFVSPVHGSDLVAVRDPSGLVVQHFNARERAAANAHARRLDDARITAEHAS